ncbi:Hsp70 family protein (plasmid) [Rhodococcus pyridinivorans]|uniref:Hsp70 family protein n=1 Tax=Rhodococcus TaxID=1827 RepID=UPI001C2F9295|nr:MULTISPECIES: Hsp70 family protein [Rhodococcus]MBX4171871.1 Hsp70 family protein [Rhodococcus sp. DMU2021]QXF84085.1 Hsp70 family protein [Rhodococcus pyridinivorans]
MEWVLAVDFGTSNTSAAHRIGPDRVESLPLTHTSNLMPSSVYVDHTGAITTGDVAINQATVDPAGFVAYPKTHVAVGSVMVRGQDVPVAHTIASVLRTVYNQALPRHNNHPPAEVVLTHPEAWSQGELDVLRHAASLAGLGGSVSLISEPRAAAFYYSRQHDAKIVKGSTIAVFDFGGTLDIAVLTATSEWTFEVIRAGGDNTLGGKNLDATVARWVDERLRDDDPDLAAWLRTPDGLDARRTLDDQIRRAKELLSEHPSATIRVTGNGADLTFTLTRDEFEQLIEPQITRGVQLAAQVLRDAGVDRSSLQALYLTGGSSRIPYVHRRLSELGSIATLDDPKTVVAKGAAGFVAGGRTTEPAADLDTEVLGPDTPRPAAPRPGAPRPDTRAAQHNSLPATGLLRLRSSRLRLFAGAALAAVAAGAAVFIAVDRDTGLPATAAAVAETAAPADGQLPAATAESHHLSATTDDVTSLLPTTLLTSSSSCDKSGFSSEGALQLQCNLNADSTLGKAIGMQRYEYVSVTAWRDDQYARLNFIRLRDTTDGTTTTISGDSSRLVNYDDSVNTSVRYTVIDRSTGLNATFRMNSVETGTTFLTELGWTS